MKDFGIDISVWQGDFNMGKAVKEGVKFVIIKGGGGDDGLYVDRRFAENYNKAKAIGLPVGVYWFSRALSPDDAIREAEYFRLYVLNGRQFELPVYIDVENSRMTSIGRRKLTDTVKAWRDHLEKYGWYTGIYTGKYIMRDCMYTDELKGWPLWIASWTRNCSWEPASDFGVWQFGGETNPTRSNKVAGVVCDQDWLMIDYPAIIKAAGKNGLTPDEPTPIPTPKEDTCMIELPVLHRGSVGGYVRTVQILLNKYNNASLAEDGGFGARTEAAVIAYQRDRGLAVDGWVGAETWRQLLC